MNAIILLQMKPVLLLGLALLACGFFRAPERTTPSWSRRLVGWQKLFGVAGFILALLIVMNPEFLALGLLGDSAFFDVLVLVLSLQLQRYIVRAWRRVCPVLSRIMRVIVLRNRMSYGYILLTLAPLGNVASAIRKALQHLSS
jgi:hypothetical protein